MEPRERDDLCKDFVLIIVIIRLPVACLNEVRRWRLQDAIAIDASKEKDLSRHN
jgi:hypothetical protein